MYIWKKQDKINTHLYAVRYDKHFTGASFLYQQRGRFVTEHVCYTVVTASAYKW
jgi:prophage antirepressor-like protein